MLLSSVGRSLTMTLNGAASPNVLTHSAYRDIDLGTLRETWGAKDNQGNGATAVDVVAHPAERTTRVVESIDIYNSDDATAVITMSIAGGDVDPQPMCKFSIATLEHLCWTPARGWHVLTVNGELRATV